MAEFGDMEVRFVKGFVDFEIDGIVVPLNEVDFKRFMKFINEVAILSDEYDTIERSRKIGVFKAEIEELEVLIAELEKPSKK